LRKDKADIPLVKRLPMASPLFGAKDFWTLKLHAVSRWDENRKPRLNACFFTCSLTAIPDVMHGRKETKKLAPECYSGSMTGGRF
jgi:hypothetical protein